MKTIVVLSGAGMSAESGLKTFRDNGGLWEDHPVEDVATPEAWLRHRALVLRFYNERRRALLEAEPNEGHRILAEWEEKFRVLIVTQNIDDLHERAGSTQVLHMHGELRKARSTTNPNIIVPVNGWQLNEGDLCPDGSQLRPHVVWFGERVTAMPKAETWVKQADFLVVVGTSLRVNPVGTLVHSASMHAKKFLIDPDPSAVHGYTVIKNTATEGLRRLAEKFH
jgi:NAD-dependent deacetylase